MSERMRRDEIIPGDVVKSSHGYTGVVVVFDPTSQYDTRTETNQHPDGVTQLVIELHRAGSGEFRTERYDRHVQIEVVTRAEAGATMGDLLAQYMVIVTNVRAGYTNVAQIARISMWAQTNLTAADWEIFNAVHSAYVGTLGKMNSAASKRQIVKSSRG